MSNQIFIIKEDFFLINKKNEEHGRMHFFKIKDTVQKADNIYFIVEEFLGIHEEFICGYRLIKNTCQDKEISLCNIKFKTSYEQHF